MTDHLSTVSNSIPENHPQRFQLEMEKRIDEGNFELVFTAGACFHFALRLHERFGYPIRGISEGYDDGLSHVWCKLPTGLGVDYRGVFPESEIIKKANAGKTAPAYDISIEEVREKIRAKETQCSPEFAKRLFALADERFDADPRFAKAQPPHIESMLWSLDKS